MNNLGASSNNIHYGDTKVFGDLTVTGIVEGNITIVGDLTVDAPNCLVADCVKAVTTGGPLSIKTTGDSTIAEFYDDQTMSVSTVTGFNGTLILASNQAGTAVASLGDGLGFATNGLRLINTKLNVNEIQSQSHEVTGNNPKILFTASKVEITGDSAIEFETKSILTTEIKKDDTGGNMIVKSADGTQILRTDDGLNSLYVGEDADGYRMPKLRNTIGHIMTMSNTGIATFEEPQQTGAHTVTGTIVSPRTTWGFGSYANVALSVAGSSSIQPNTWAIGDVLTLTIAGQWSSTTRTGGTSNFRLVLGQSLLSQVSDNVQPTSNSSFTDQPFDIYIALTRTGTNSINWVGNGIFQDNDGGGGKPSKQFTFGKGTLAGYDATLALSVDLDYIDNSTSGTGDRYVRYVCQTGIWAQSTPSSVVPTISTTDHTALTNLELGDAGHSQFALLTGRSGGQTVSGSSLTGESLTLQSNIIDSGTGFINVNSTINMNLAKIQNVGNATAGFDALNRATGDGRYLQLTGGDLTGDLTVQQEIELGTGNANGILRFVGSALNRTYIPDNVAIAHSTILPSNVLLSYHSTTTGARSFHLASDTTLNMNDSTIFGSDLASGDLTLSSTTNATKGNIIMLDPLVVNSIDGAGTLTIAPADSTKLELGASDIKTEVKGELDSLGAVKTGTDFTGYTEPVFSDDATYLSSEITKTGRNYVRGNFGNSRCWAIAPQLIQCGVTTTNYKLVCRFNSGTAGGFGVVIAPGLAIDSALSSPYGGFFIRDATYSPTADFGTSAGARIGTDNLGTVTIVDGDIVEYRLDNTCSDMSLYFHGLTQVPTPTLLYKWGGLTATNVRFFIGDQEFGASTFNIDTLPNLGLEVAENAEIHGDATVYGNLSVGGTISGNVGSSLNATSLWTIDNTPVAGTPTASNLVITKVGGIVNIMMDDFEAKTPDDGRYESVYTLPVEYRPTQNMRCAVIQISATVPNVGFIEVTTAGKLLLSSNAANKGWAVAILVGFPSPSITYSVF
tara:strand:+ start:7388 stop:10432 length:3045 start_codon:yes stop_codon:yes gene_type:complete